MVEKLNENLTVLAAQYPERVVAGGEVGELYAVFVAQGYPVLVHADKLVAVLVLGGIGEFQGCKIESEQVLVVGELNIGILRYYGTGGQYPNIPISQYRTSGC